MEANIFLKKVEALISRLPDKVKKLDLNQQITELLLSRHITKKECEKVKVLIKNIFTAHSTIEEQSKIQAEIETLCNSI